MQVDAEEDTTKESVSKHLHPVRQSNPLLSLHPVIIKELLQMYAHLNSNISFKLGCM